MFNIQDTHDLFLSICAEIFVIVQQIFEAAVLGCRILTEPIKSIIISLRSPPPPVKRQNLACFLKSLFFVCSSSLYYFFSSFIKQYLIHPLLSSVYSHSITQIDHKLVCVCNGTDIPITGTIAQLTYSSIFSVSRVLIVFVEVCHLYAQTLALGACEIYGSDIFSYSSVAKFLALTICLSFLEYALLDTYFEGVKRFGNAFLNQLLLYVLSPIAIFQNSDFCIDWVHFSVLVSWLPFFAVVGCLEYSTYQIVEAILCPILLIVLTFVAFFLLQKQDVPNSRGLGLLMKKWKSLYPRQTNRFTSYTFSSYLFIVYIRLVVSEFAKSKLLFALLIILPFVVEFIAYCVSFFLRKIWL